ncbi:MAG TPA: hypothetical protein VLT47_04455, partial [Anaeromyxobacteraceae bacterium]|nr:hypothetical protein [Anaeromyxobacteraceae bacterium]
ILVGERYLREEGAPPRIVLVRGQGEAGGTFRVGDGNVATYEQQLRAYLWGTETPPAWAPGAYYIGGALVVSGGNIYSAGSTNTSGATAPTGTTTSDDGAIVWSYVSEAPSDLARYEASEALLDRFVNVCKALAPGRVSIKTIEPSVETNVVTFGEELQVVVTWSRSIPRDAKVWAWASTLTAVSPPDPARPQGDTGKTFTLATTIAPVRP